MISLPYNIPLGALLTYCSLGYAAVKLCRAVCFVEATQNQFGSDNGLLFPCIFHTLPQISNFLHVLPASRLLQAWGSAFSSVSWPMLKSQTSSLPRSYRSLRRPASPQDTWKGRESGTMPPLWLKRSPCAQGRVACTKGTGLPAGTSQMPCPSCEQLMTIAINWIKLSSSV